MALGNQVVKGNCADLIAAGKINIQTIKIAIPGWPNAMAVFLASPSWANVMF